MKTNDSHRSATMRRLTDAEIHHFAGRADVRRIAVENYLSTLSGDRFADSANLHADTIAYRWNAQTVKAIADGIKLAYSRR